MPPKRPPAPIDRPLSKAYLRQFSGWSTAYPPGISEPNSLRLMENVMITRDGAARVRPGLRSLLRERTEYPLVGSHELFYDDTGRAYLVAVRTATAVEFRVIRDVDSVPTMVTLAEAGFVVEGQVSFSLNTTYVKYLQIDNKVFALSNAPEPMLMFWVGAEKRAKRLTEILRPEWSVEDKLQVVHPDADWILRSALLSSRTNRCQNPSFETSLADWSSWTLTDASRSTDEQHIGTYSMKLESRYDRINLLGMPLHNPNTYGTAGWFNGPRCDSLTVVNNRMRVTLDKQSTSNYGMTMSRLTDVTPGETLRFAYDLGPTSGLAKHQMAVRFFRSNGDIIGGDELVGGNTNLDQRRVYSRSFVVPDQATQMRVLIGGYPSSSTVKATIDIRNVCLNLFSMSTDALSGDDGTDYFWTGAVNASPSVYHPPQDIGVWIDTGSGQSGDYVGSAYVKSDASRTMRVRTRSLDSGADALLDAEAIVVTTTAWARYDSGVLAAPAGTNAVDFRVVIEAVPRGEAHYVDSVLVEKAAAVGDYFHGSYPPSANDTARRWLGDVHESRSVEEVFDTSSSTNPVVETPTTSTLISSDPADNVYSFGFYYTVSNELGESAESQITVVRTQRPWTSWDWKMPDSLGAPTTDTDNPDLCADQLSVVMPQEVFDAAVAAGATKWTAYFSTWGPNDVPPVTATRFAEIRLDENPAYGTHSHAELTPRMVSIGSTSPVVPTEQTRFNATDPSRGSQGLVAADRLIVVGDPDDPARITWSSAAPGQYYNFSPSLGGGEKQLTTGNLYLTAAVKLWQNPQSVDTLTILTMGDDGRSNAHYMQPATITSLSETVTVMGFEEVSMMEGTASPYGCEVLNNGLYHPTTEHLIKSTANNYNLSHKTVTETIENMWRALQTHRRIVSSQLENRLYYLVHNRLGDALHEGCWGNEVWVCDIAAKTPTWSRWKAQGISLRTIEIENKVMMSIVHPDGIFAFDPEQANDEVFDPDTGDIELVNIGWYLETNTQGANRAHDAWCNLQQANVVFGNFEGQLRYGIRGIDVNGMPINIEKVVVATNPPADGLGEDGDRTESALSPFDREDFFLIRKIMREWFFYAGSIDDIVEDVDDEFAVPRFSAGQISLVQYRYTPTSVNVGYEYGSVETFEYGESYAAEATTDSGVPKPYVDVSRP